MVQTLAAASGPVGEDATADAERVDLLRALEDLKNAAVGLQAAVTEEFDLSQRGQQVAAGESPRRAGQGVASQVALARRVSPHAGRRQLSLARVLRAELPCTYQALRAGRITERAASVMAQGTACVSREHRLAIDAEVAGDPDAIERLGERGVQVAAARAAYRLDPASVVERRRRAEADRYVSLRPAPDTMAYLTALLPVSDGVAIYAALSKAADTARATGEPAIRGQVMADALRDAVLMAAERGITMAPVAGTAPASAPGVDETSIHPAGTDAAPDDHVTEVDLDGAPAGVGVVLNVIMTEQQLFGRHEASEGEALLGGPAGGLVNVDADLARQIAALTPADRVWLRRLYTRPDSGELVAIDSRRRSFPPGLQRLIRFRDQHCRTPWCHAPIRHTDHATPAAEDGLTTRDNGQGKCEACNYAKQAPGWLERPEDDDGSHRVRVTTPTGHTYTSSSPAPPGARAPTSGRHPAGSGSTVRTLWLTRPAPTVEIVLRRPPEAA